MDISDMWDDEEDIRQFAKKALTHSDLVAGAKYNWKGQPERLVYIGKNWSGNGYWHQFEKINDPGKVWCEVLDGEISCFEETRG